MRGQRKPSPPDASVTFTYESAYNQIVHPSSYVSLSQYFIAHWMPDISPAGLKILLQLRSMGYFNPKAGVQRGDIDIEQKELAALCGMSLSTLKRAFGDDPILSAYVQRVFETKRDPLTGRIVKEHYLYVVKMDDVLTPADKARLDELLQGPGKGEGNPGDSPKGQNDPSDQPPIAQNELSGVQNEPPTAQNEPPVGQNDPSLNREIHTSNTFDTPNTAARPGVSASLSQNGASRFQDLVEDVLDTLPVKEYAALESIARGRVIAEAAEPIRSLAKMGKAVVDVKRMMLTILRESNLREAS